MCNQECKNCTKELYVFPDVTHMCVDPKNSVDRQIANSACAYVGANQRIETVCRQPAAFTPKPPTKP